MIDETATLTVSTKPLLSMSCDSRFVRGKCLCWVLQSGKIERRGLHVRWVGSTIAYAWSCLVIAAFLFTILYIMTSRASLRLSSRLQQFFCCNMSPTLDVFRWHNLFKSLYQIIILISKSAKRHWLSNGYHAHIECDWSYIVGSRLMLSYCVMCMFSA
jgi:uncharacterized protein YggT (Ycf19 family)